MADTERIIVVDPAAQARQQLVEDMKKLKEHPLDVTVPGGYFLVDGEPQDAEGNKIAKRSDASLKAEVAKIAKSNRPAGEKSPAELRSEAAAAKKAAEEAEARADAAEKALKDAEKAEKAADKTTAKGK